MARRHSSAIPLALAYAALIVYASLYPFTGWRAVATSSPLEWLWLPWPHWWLQFDIVANLVGYLPFGALVLTALVRSGGSLRVSCVVAVLMGVGLSFALETIQNFLPQRVPSRADWALNSAGTLLGVALAAIFWRRGVIERWQSMRERWVEPHSAGALALLMLWPFGLLYPPPLPLALGGGLALLPAFFEALLEGTALEPWTQSLADPGLATVEPLSPLRAGLAIVLGLLAPCLLALAVARPGWRRVVLPFGALLIGGAVTALSSALSFGPAHAFLWLSGVVPAALAVGLALALLLAALPPRAALGAGLVALTALVAMVVQIPLDPYYAQSLQSWERGRFIHFHGLARWIGWCWPYLAIGWMLMRLARPTSKPE